MASNVPSSPHQFLDGSILDAASALRRGEVTVPELIQQVFQRIASTTHLNAYTDVYEDSALEVANAHQALFAAGRDLGPLHGIPVSVKDNIDVANRPTRAGSRVVNYTPPVDAFVIAALKRAGAIIVGKNTMHELAWGGTTVNPHFGTATNPWAPGRSPGGSSGGGGIAVAARTVFASMATDTGGSIRLPASLNGVTGLRPSIGCVSNDGVFPLSWTLDVTGPVARSSQDCALVLEAIAGHRGVHGRTAQSRNGGLDRPLEGTRIGWVEGYCLDYTQQPVATAFLSALEVLRALGAVISAVQLPDSDAIVDCLLVINAAEATALHHPWLVDRRAEYGTDVLAQLDAGGVFTAVDYIQAQRYRTHLRSRMDAVFDEVDAFISPTVPYTVPFIGQTTFELGGQPRDLHRSNMHFNALASLTGLPALSVPMGFDDEGLPTGLQIMTPAHTENRALQIGHQYQRNTEHHLRTPSIASARNGDHPYSQ